LDGLGPAAIKGLPSRNCGSPPLGNILRAPSKGSVGIVRKDSDYYDIIGIFHGFHHLLNRWDLSSPGEVQHLPVVDLLAQSSKHHPPSFDLMLMAPAKLPCFYLNL
jgi:hypothetical protein